MNATNLEFVNFILLMALGIAWDYTFQVSKDLLDAKYPNSKVIEFSEGGMTLLLIYGTYVCMRKETRAQKTSKKHFWFALAMLGMIAANSVGEDFVFSVIHAHYAGTFSTWASVVTLVAIMMILTTLQGLYLYSSGTDTGIGRRKRMRDRPMVDKRASAIAACMNVTPPRGGVIGDSDTHV